MSFENGMKVLSLESPDYDAALIPTYDIAQLSQLKKSVEKSLFGYYDDLKSFNCDLNTQLLTPDGFPRADIDVVQVRLLRTKIIRLQNDYKSVMKAIDLKMQSHFTNQSTSSQGAKTDPTITNTSIAVPFAKITHVVNTSPAETAGLMLEDRVVSMGHINATNHDYLKKIPGLVRDHMDRELNVVVVRNGELIKLKLIPNANWGGQGILGCKLDQL